MLINSCVLFYLPLAAFLCLLKCPCTESLSTVGFICKRRASSTHVGSRQLQPPPLQNGINAKLFKIPFDEYWFLMNKILLHVFTEFEPHSSKIFQENSSLLYMIGTKHSDQMNLKQSHLLYILTDA